MKGRSAERALKSRQPRNHPESNLNAEASATDATYEMIFEAIIDHRLRPGQKLGEDKMMEVLQASRMRVRDALARLSHEKLVTIIPYRGAFVAEPSMEEARQVFAARKAIEVATTRELARHATKKQVAELRECIARERDAWSSGDNRRAIILSRDFHLRIAAMSGNLVLEEILRGLISRVSLVIALYDRPGNPDCFFHGHMDLIEAISTHDEEKAAREMADHIQLMEDHLNLMRIEEKPLDLADVFQARD